MSTETFAIAGVSLPVAIFVVVQAAKKVGLPSWTAPIVAIVAGILVGVAVKLLEPDKGSWVFFIVVGLMEGLVAAGGYSGTKAVVEHVKGPK